MDATATNRHGDFIGRLGLFIQIRCAIVLLVVIVVIISSIALERPAQSANTILHIGASLLRSEHLCIATLLGKISIHESTTMLAHAIARNPSRQIQLEWKLVVVRQLFPWLDRTLGNDNDTLQVLVGRESWNHLGDAVGIAVVVDIAAVPTMNGSINDQLIIESELVVLSALLLIHFLSGFRNMPLFSNFVSPANAAINPDSFTPGDACHRDDRMSLYLGAGRGPYTEFEPAVFPEDDAKSHNDND